MNQIYLGKREKEILKLVGLGILITASLAVPTLPQILEPFIRNKAKKSNTKRMIKKLEEKNVIYLSGDKIQLTEKGIELLHKIECDDIEIPRPRKWDHIWRIIAYDIPDRKKKERNYFRKKLELMGFVKVQESLFAFPFECKEEIAVVSQCLGVSPYVVFMVTDNIPNSKTIIRKLCLE